MSTHTPGPWFAERHGIVTADVGGHRRQLASTTGDAVMHGDPEVSVIEIQMANAHLIAAAPDLLLILKTLAARIHSDICARECCDECIEATREIERAEGRS
jgi:hypothetical protein